MAMTLRLPADLEPAVKATAEREHTSQHAVIVEAVRRYTSDRDNRRDAIIERVMQRDAELLNRLA